MEIKQWIPVISYAHNNELHLNAIQRSGLYSIMFKYLIKPIKHLKRHIGLFYIQYVFCLDKVICNIIYYSLLNTYSMVSNLLVLFSLGISVVMVFLQPTEI